MSSPSTHTPSARDVAIARLAGQARRFPQLHIEPLDVGAFEPRDAALAAAIDHAVARRWLTLEAVLQHCLDRHWQRLQAQVQAPLLAAAAQLLLLERVPEHAAIDAAVGWTRHRRGAAAAGMVNAVLRRLSGIRESIVERHDPQRRDEIPLSDGRAWRLREPVLAEDPLHRLAQTTSHPVEMLERWRGQFGESAMRDVAAHSLVQPPIIIAGIAGDEPRVTPHETSGFFVYQGPRGGLHELLADHPEARVQDPTAAAAAHATRLQQPALIVDLCAGRGTKTAQLAALHPEATILASDADRRRLALLREAAAAWPRVEVVAPQRLIDHAGRADMVLVDAPCSNTGVLARRVEAKYRFDEASIASLAELQRQLLVDALRLLKPSGTVVYSTCSIDDAENQAQVRWIERWHGFTATTAWSRLPQGGPGDAPQHYSDGGFFAMLRHA